MPSGWRGALYCPRYYALNAASYSHASAFRRRNGLPSNGVTEFKVSDYILAGCTNTHEYADFDALEIYSKAAIRKSFSIEFQTIFEMMLKPTTKWLK
jgi:hypothetical protein